MARHNWANAATLSTEATNHVIDMENRYLSEINAAIASTEIFTDSVQFPEDFDSNKITTPEFLVIDSNSVDALFYLRDKYDIDTYSALKHNQIAVLNFASYNTPGGGFMRGAMAQEESLCHASFLYNVLLKKTEYYDYNTQHKNRGLYTNRAMWTPDVVFETSEDGDVLQADVLTCAAPNKSLMYKYGNFTEAGNTRALKQRIKFIADIVNIHNVDIIVLGAFGCGVFRNDPKEVAELFYENFRESTAKKVVFAIPDMKNRASFEEIFLKKEKR